jgi:Rieske Fe-S protein
MSDTAAPISRRQFCTGACQVASCATLATLVSACGGSPTSPSGGGGASALGRVNGQYVQGTGVRVNIAGTPLATVGGAVLAESTAGVFLISRTAETTFSTIDAVCTHESCTVTGAEGATYVCPCHGSRYSRTGQVQQGPARANLRQFSNTFADGVVTIAI